MHEKPTKKLELFRPARNGNRPAGAYTLTLRAGAVPIHSSTSQLPAGAVNFGPAVNRQPGSRGMGS